jgi:hypothetical protein
MTAERGRSQLHPNRGKRFCYKSHQQIAECGSPSKTVFRKANQYNQGVGTIFCADPAPDRFESGNSMRTTEFPSRL